MYPILNPGTTKHDRLAYAALAQQIAQGDVDRTELVEYEDLFEFYNDDETER